MLKFNDLSGTSQKIEIKDKEIIVCSEQECNDIIDAAKVARDMKESMRGTQKHWQRIGEIPASMYYREVQLPSKGQKDIAEDLTFRLLARYPHLRATDGSIAKRGRHI